MKTIESIQIWNNGVIKTASVLNTYAQQVILNENAIFYFALFELNNDGSLGEKIQDGNLFMDTSIYQTWDQDEIAWDFVAKSLNIVITGDYVAPQPPVVEEPIQEQIVEELPKSEEII